MAIPAGLQAIIDRLAAFYNGSAYNAASNPGGFARGGNQQGAGGVPQGNFIAMLRDVAGFGQGIVALAVEVEDARGEVASNLVLTAEDAENTRLDRIATAENVVLAAGKVTEAAAQAQRIAGTSTTSNTSTIASKTFTTQADKAFDVGSYVHIQSRGTLNRWMAGRVTGYSGTSLTVAVEAIGTTTSAGTDWDIRVAGARGAQGDQGVPGIPTMGYSARTSNTQIVAADAAKIIDITSGTFTQTFAAAATLGDGFYIVLRNSGTGDITIDPNGSETIDGLTSFISYPGEVRIIQCNGTTFRSLVVEGGTKVFTSSGNFTWPPGINGAVVDAEAGGGGGGRPGNSWSGGGGGGGGREQRVIAAQPGGTQITATVGSGGIGATTDNTGGGNGGGSQLGNLVRAAGGNGGGSQNAGNGGPAGPRGGFIGPHSTSSTFGSAGGYGGQDGRHGQHADRGGGGGGSGSSSNPGAAGNGGESLYGGGGGGSGGVYGSIGGFGGAAGNQGSATPGGAGSTAGGNGFDGSAGTEGYGGGGGGGGGSGGNSAGAIGGKGGNGGFPSGGGGGGGGQGAGSNGTNGNGGNGGAGRIVVRMF